MLGIHAHTMIVLQSKTIVDLWVSLYVSLFASTTLVGIYNKFYITVQIDWIKIDYF